MRFQLNNQYSRKYNLNFDYFKKWSPVMAYLLGYLFADGNMDISKNRGHRMALQVESADKEEVELLNKELGREKGIDSRKRPSKNERTYYVAICSKEICKDLMKLGIVPRKSAIIEFPIIPNKFLKEFVAGYFKGDGTIGLMKKNKFSQKYINKQGIIKIYRYTYPRSYCYPFVSFKSKSKKFLTELNNKISNRLEIRNGKIYPSDKSRKAFELRFSIRSSRQIMNWFEIKKEKVNCKIKKVSKRT